MKELREEFVLALKTGASGAELVRIVLRHKSLGVSQPETYEVLEGIRKELDCDLTEEDNPVCERLERIMDQVWGYCSKVDAIWETPLSDVK